MEAVNVGFTDTVRSFLQMSRHLYNPSFMPEYESNLCNLVKKLVNAERILFLPQGDLEKATGHYRINNAELILLAGLCVAQGIRVKIVTDSRSPDFSEISVSMTEKLTDFMN